MSASQKYRVLFNRIHSAMDIFASTRTSVTFLIVSDVDVTSAYLLSEKFVPSSPKFDCIICCGPFHNEETPNVSRSAVENEGIYLGDMAGILAALENIVCRVIYLPVETDPLSVFTESVHLTPNSVNLYSRRITLMAGLFATGYTEISESLERFSSGVESESQSDWVELGSEYQGSRLVGPTELDINELLAVGTQKANAVTAIAEPVSSQSHCVTNCGIFVLNYVYAHTLNQLLFHKTEEFRSSNISVCIVNHAIGNSNASSSASSSISSSAFPKNINGITVIMPPSLKIEKKYAVLEIVLKDEKWQVSSTSIENL